MKVYFNGRYARIDEGSRELITAGSIGLSVTAAFDASWAALQHKTAVFSGGGNTRTVLESEWDGDRIPIPPECMARPTDRLIMGVYGWNMAGNFKVTAIPTIYVSLGAVRPGADPNADPSATVPGTVAEQIIEMIGDLDELETEAKDNLVAAINEALSQAGGTTDHTELENRDAANQHPMSAISGLEDALEDKADADDVPTALSDLTSDTDHRTVSDVEKQTWNAKQSTISDLDAIRAGAAKGNTAVQPETGKGLFSGSYNDLTNKPTIPDITGLATEQYVDTEINDVQTQIDAIVSKSDVVDVVANYAALQAYDTTTLLDKDVVKVLDDSTHSNQRSYYRWVITAGVGAWEYIGSEAVGYTKAETDTLLSGKQDTISDLATIRSGAALGATALQSVPSGYATETYVTNAIAAAIGDAIGGSY